MYQSLSATNLTTATERMNRYETLKTSILNRLTEQLPSHLYYHGVHHTVDVLEAVQRLGDSESVSESDMELLKVAALFHDSGFLENPSNHENIGCIYARRELPSYGYSASDIEKICGMIMATRYPQHPQNRLEEILCDADLDYLGRDDFFSIGKTLFEELKAAGRLSTEKEWNRLQVNFLSTHHYFTKTANETRNAAKEAHFSKVRELLAMHS